MVATTTKRIFCIEEVPPLIEIQKLSSVRYRDRLTKFCFILKQHLLFANVAKLDNNSFQKIAETLKKFDCKIYQWPMNGNLKVSDQKLHRTFFRKI